MKKYYIQTNNDQKGPLDIEELKALQINANTPVWYEGLADWTTAGKVEELKSILHATPPPFKAITKPPEVKKSSKPILTEEQRRSDARWRRNWTVGFLLVLGVIIAIAVNQNMRFSHYSDPEPGTTSSEQTYKEKKLSIREMEEQDPLAFLETDGRYRGTLIGNALKITGTITNNATVANYQNVILEFYFKNSRGDEIGTRQYKVDGIFPAGKTKDFEMRIAKPDRTETVGWDVVQASAY